MVFFTCNHCGDSAKKPAVEKHYNTKCRGAPIFVSCMDCQKDFRNQEYVEHTKCISEAEKYSGKDYVPKESQNKGQKKQDSWIEIVHSILTTSEYNLNPSVKTVFQRLQNYDNVPRKGAKFENFVSNSMRINKNQAKEVWKILEMELNKLKSSSKTANGNVIESNGHTENVDLMNLTTEEPIECIEDLIKSKKDKKSKKRILDDTNIELESVAEDKEIPEEPKKKKKKSKNEPIVEDIEMETNGKIPEEPKNKKKKSKNDTMLEEVKVLKQMETNEETAGESKKKKKKSKNETIPEEAKMLIELETNGKITAESKKNKKKLKNGSIQKEIKVLEIKTNGKTPANENDGTFKWSIIIAETAKDGMSVEKLKKKVIQKHKSIIGHDESTNLNKLEKTFKKYLKKSILTVDMNNDTIKINQ